MWLEANLRRISRLCQNSSSSDLVPEGDKFNSRGHRPRVEIESTTNPARVVSQWGYATLSGLVEWLSAIRGRRPRLLNLSPSGKEAEIDF